MPLLDGRTKMLREHLPPTLLLGRGILQATASILCTPPSVQ